MSDAAHPQHEDAPEAQDGDGVEGLLAKNPFPTQITVPGPDGQPRVLDLAMAGGMLYAPGLDDEGLAPQVRAYVISYCSAWSSTVLTNGQLEHAWPEPPRRAQVGIPESQLHTLLGLAADERLLRVDVDQVSGRLRFLVESPRLPRQPFWDGGPPVVTLPISAYYESAAGTQ